MADWESRSSGGTSRGASGGISPSEERRLKLRARSGPTVGSPEDIGIDNDVPSPVYRQQYPAITNQFRNLIADPRTGQMHEAAMGPAAGPVISPQQWMSQHPMMQLGNLFARALSVFPFAMSSMNYRDPWQAPEGVNRR